MKVRVQFFSHLKDLVGSSEVELELADHTTAGELLNELYSCYPNLRQWDSSILIGAGVEFVGRDYVVKSSDELSIMPPVQGG